MAVAATELVIRAPPGLTCDEEEARLAPQPAIASASAQNAAGNAKPRGLRAAAILVGGQIVGVLTIT